MVYLWHRAHLRHGPQCYPSLPLLAGGWFITSCFSGQGIAKPESKEENRWPCSHQKPWTWLLPVATLHNPHGVWWWSAHWGFPQGSCDSAIAGKMAWPSIGLPYRGHFWMNGPFGTLGTNTNGEERMLLYPCLLCHLTQCPDIVLCRDTATGKSMSWAGKKGCS